MQKDFIWNGRRPKIKHSTLIADYAEGGYKEIDIETKMSSLKVIWIKKLIDDNFHAWKAIPMAWLYNNGSIQIFNENFKPSQYLLHKLSYLPHFYRELTLFWENVSHTEPDDMYLRYLNKAVGITNIFVKVTLVYIYPCLSAKGTNKIGDIFSDSGTLLQWKDAIDTHPSHLEVKALRK